MKKPRNESGYAVIDAKGVNWGWWTNRRQAVTDARRWDAEFPDLAPHRIYRASVTYGEQVHP